MRKTIAIVLATALLCLCGCSLFSSDDKEPFSAAFTIRTTGQPTEIFFDVPYSEEDTNNAKSTTKTFASDSLNFGDLRNLFAKSVFPDKEDVTHMWQGQIRYCLQGGYTAWDSNAVADVCRDLIGVSGFPGMRQTTASNANVTIRFSDAAEGSFDFDIDSSQVIRGGVITIPQHLSNDERQALIDRYLMQLCGFVNTVDTPLDSVLNKNDPAPALTEVDLILLDILYGEMESDMSRNLCLHTFDAHFQ